MIKKIFIDTGGLIAFVNQNEKRHLTAKKLLSEYQNKTSKLYTSDYVIDEFLTYLRCKQKVPVTQIVQCLQLLELSEIEIYGITKDLFGLALKLMAKYQDQYFSFTDCVSFAVMKELKINNVMTTDKHFEIFGYRNFLEV